MREGIDRTEVYKAIDSEREYQQSLREERRFTEEILPIAGELECIRHYLNKATASYAENPGETPAETIAIVRKIAGMCIRAMEHYGAPQRGKCLN